MLDSSTINAARDLLPGLLASMVIFILTRHQRPPITEQVIIALIFTGLIKSTVGYMVGIPYIKFLFGNEFDPYVLAIIYALLVSVAVNSRFLAKVVFFLKISRNSFTLNQWVASFDSIDAYVILNLKDGKRIMGFPIRYSLDNMSGHVLLYDIDWINNDGTFIDDGSEKPSHILIESCDIKFVEFFEEKNIKTCRLLRLLRCLKLSAKNVFYLLCILFFCVFFV